MDQAADYFPPPGHETNLGVERDYLSAALSYASALRPGVDRAVELALAARELNAISAKYPQRVMLLLHDLRRISRVSENRLPPIETPLPYQGPDHAVLRDVTQAEIDATLGRRPKEVPKRDDRDDGERGESRLGERPDGAADRGDGARAGDAGGELPALGGSW